MARVALRKMGSQLLQAQRRIRPGKGVDDETPAVLQRACGGAGFRDEQCFALAADRQTSRVASISPPLP